MYITLLFVSLMPHTYSQCNYGHELSSMEVNAVKRLKPLMGNHFAVTDTGFTYKIGICTEADLRLSATETKYKTAGGVQVSTADSTLSRVIGDFKHATINASRDWIKLEYSGGDHYSSHCNLKPRKTKIMLLCDPSETIGILKLLSETIGVSECYYMFEIRHTDVCVDSVTIMPGTQPMNTTTTGCHFKQITEFKSNQQEAVNRLASLVGYRFVVDTSAGYIFNIGICTAAVPTLMDGKYPTAGVIQRHKEDASPLSIAGDITDARINAGSDWILLEYGSGDPYRYQHYRNTRIMIKCSALDTTGTITFISQSDGSYLFELQHSSICPVVVDNITEVTSTVCSDMSQGDLVPKCLQQANSTSITDISTTAFMLLLILLLRHSM